MDPRSIGDLPLKQRRRIRAWCMYDWANSAFATSVAAISPVYFVFLFKEAVGENGTVLGIFTGSSMWGLGVALSTAVVALSSPVIGVISDRVPIRRALLAAYTVLGALFTALAFFVPWSPLPWLWMFVTFVFANIGFVGGLIVYNSFLPHLGPRHLLDAISSRGYAYGYLGGGLLLVVHLALVLAARGGDYADLVTRLAFVSVGVWWFGWALWTLRVVPEPPLLRSGERVTPASAVATGFRELRQTLRELARFRVVVVFLAAYVLFNDGLQTVLAIAGAYAADTLGIPLAFNMGTIAIIQFVAVPGALAFGRLADRISTKSALTVALCAWAGIVLLGVSLAPLPPGEHGDFEIRLAYAEGSGDYVVEAAPGDDEPVELRLGGAAWELEEGDAVRPSRRRLARRGGARGGGRRALALPAGRTARRRLRRRRGPPLGPGRRPRRLVALARAGARLAAARARGRAPVAPARDDGGLGDRGEPGPRPQPLRPDHAPQPQRGVLLLLRLHRPGVLGLRPDGLHRGDGDLRHARRRHLHPRHHPRGHRRAEVGRRRRGRPRRGRGGCARRLRIARGAGPPGSGRSARAPPAGAPAAPGEDIAIDAALVLLVVALKYLLPLLLIPFPFAAGWSNFVLDSVDGDILVPLGLEEGLYQNVDKSADYVTYICMVIAAWRWPLRRAVIALFALRSVGQALFFLTGEEIVFLLFPNFLEPLFLAYASIAFLKRSEAPAFFERHAVAIWLVVVCYKLQDEYVTHVANVDRTELLGRLAERLTGG